MPGGGENAALGERTAVFSLPLTELRAPRLSAPPFPVLKVLEES